MLAAATASASGCAATTKTAGRPAGPPAPLQTATKQQLMASYDEQASAISSIHAMISMRLTAGTAYSGVIKQYHEVKGFLLAQKPASIRVIGQAPLVGTNIFDMASDGERFHVYVPSKNKFLEGPTNFERRSAQPIENLRPQHLMEAIFWTRIADRAAVLLEAGDESEARYYIMTVVQRSEGNSTATAGGSAQNKIFRRLTPVGFELLATQGGPSMAWVIDRKIWFDRADLSVVRLQVYDSGGSVTSDVRYAQWDRFGSVRFARQIELTRPAEDYALRMGFTKLDVNEPLSADKFELRQPEGTELVHVGEDRKEPKP